jgi:hypothetical protein
MKLLSLIALAGLALAGSTWRASAGRHPVAAFEAELAAFLVMRSGGA